MATTAPKPLRVAMNGVTGRMGYRQHLTRPVLPIRQEGGLLLPDGTRRPVEPVLVGRDPRKPRDIAERHDIAEWSTDVAAVLADPGIDVYFDAQVTALRPAAVRTAVAAGSKHVYAEKPTAPTLREAVELAAAARDAGVVVEFLRDVVAGRPHRHDLLSAARGVQLAELPLRSSGEGRRVPVPEIAL